MATAIWSDSEKKWTIRITANGVTKKFTSNKEGLAGKKAVLAKARAWQDGSMSNKNKLVSHCYAEFLENTQARLGVKCDSFKDHEKFGRLYILPAIGRMRINTVTKNNYQTILNTARPHDKRTKVLSKKYLMKMKSSIEQFAKFCYENGYCESLRGKLFIPTGHPTKGKIILQPNEIKRLFEPSDLWYHRSLLFSLCTGMRPSEVLGLQWDDIYADHIEIRRAVREGGRITSGKTSNAIRAIPLTTFTSDILDEQKKATASLKSEWVFCSLIGTVGSQSTMGHHYDQLGEERGFGGSLYSLRHTFVSMHKSTMPESLLRMIIGHTANPAGMDTIGIYGNHIVDGDLKKSAEIMELTFKKVQNE